MNPLIRLAVFLALAPLACELNPMFASDIPDAGPDGSEAEAEAESEAEAEAEAESEAEGECPEEICDGRDNDCDDVIDEDFNLNTDTNNCGACGESCTYLNAFAVCTGGKCSIGPCAPGYFDLNSNPSDGCEYECVVTNGGDEDCDELDNDCDGNADETFDFDSDPTNCGGCNIACLFTNASGICNSGDCEMGDCDLDFYDLDGLEATGCEYACISSSVLDDCGAGDEDCDGLTDEDFTPAVCGSAVGACMEGLTECPLGVEVCAGQVGPSAELCNNTDDDCDGEVDDGYDKLTNPQYCQSCAGCDLPNSIEGCLGGTCLITSCLVGFHDEDGVDANGCEYPCSPTGPEVCDGQDNNCDGEIDELDLDDFIPLGGNPCGTLGECSGASASCHGVAGWVCDYASTVDELSDGVLALDEELCDGLDNDCDGVADEPFVLLGTACTGAGEGLCQETGTYECASDNSGVVCNTLPSGVDPGDVPEACNGIDDDCDGTVDEDANALVNVNRDGLDFYIFAYEASRVNATSVSAGSDESSACSEPNVIPWTSLTFAAANDACAAAGMRLCEPSEWLAACEGPPSDPGDCGDCPRTYPYGDTYDSGSLCNGDDFDTNSSTPADDDGLIGTGSQSGCVSYDGVFDLSGNAKEFVLDSVGSPTVTGYRVRGGGDESLASGLTCRFTATVVPTDFLFPNLGFRCCCDPAIDAGCPP